MRVSDVALTRSTLLVTILRDPEPGDIRLRPFERNGNAEEILILHAFDAMTEPTDGNRTIFKLTKFGLTEYGFVMLKEIFEIAERYRRSHDLTFSFLAPQGIEPRLYANLVDHESIYSASFCLARRMSLATNLPIQGKSHFIMGYKYSELGVFYPYRLYGKFMLSHGTFSYSPI